MGCPINPGQVFVSKVARKGTMYFEGRNPQQLAYIMAEAIDLEDGAQEGVVRVGDIGEWMPPESDWGMGRAFLIATGTNPDEQKWCSYGSLDELLRDWDPISREAAEAILVSREPLAQEPPL
jgi:hypothetical protein